MRCRKQILQMSVLGLMVAAAVGCASNMPDAKDARAAGEWRFRLPATPSPYGTLAYGSGGSSEPAAQLAEADDLKLVPATPAAKREPSVTRPRLASVKPQAKSLPSPKSDPQIVEQPVATAAAPAPAPVLLASNSAAPETRYAQREAKSQKLQEYRGGDAIVISGGVLLIVLLIVILVLLLR